MPEHTQATTNEDSSSIATNRRVPTVEPEIEPEYVGVHSAITAKQCQNYLGEHVDDIERCENDATHTVVMYRGNKLAEIASCDDCGEPDDLPNYDCEWTGVIKREQD